MKESDKDYYKGYREGYMAGYRAGVEDEKNGSSKKSVDSEVMELPIEAMAVSKRAYNCLRVAGCFNVADVAAMDEAALTTARKLGAVTLKEIAAWLQENGILHTAWERHL